VITSASLIVVGVAGWVVVLTGQGLDRGEKWVSIAGAVVSAILSAAGLWLGWLTWRQSAAELAVRVRRTGDATAHGPGSRANTGVVGRSSSKPRVIEDTGSARATGGGRANTGEDHLR
jgi:hypothetical protein